MRNIGLLAVCAMRLFTQLTYTYYGDYWYFIGQSMLETYLLLYALLIIKDKMVYYPIHFFFILSSLNFITDISAIKFGFFYPILIALLMTFGAYIWNNRK